MEENKFRKNIELNYFDCEVSIRPLISSFVSRNNRVSSHEKDLIYSRIKKYKGLLINNLSPIDIKYKDTIVNIFNRFQSYIEREITIADKREDLDLKKRFYETIKNLYEFMFFTSAVITGYIVSPIINSSPISLPIMGFTGLTLYFLNDLIELITILSINPRESNKNKKILGPNVKEIEKSVVKMNNDEVIKKIHRLENVLLSTDPENTLSLNEVLLLERLYIKNIDRGDLKNLLDNLGDRDIKRGIYLLETLIKEYVEMFVLSLSAVDSNRPIPKPLNMFKRIFSSRGITRFLGYVMLNSVTFTFFYNSFEGNKSVIIGITLLLAIIAFYFISFLEKGFTKEISKLLEKIQG